MFSNALRRLESGSTHLSPVGVRGRQPDGERSAGSRCSAPLPPQLTQTPEVQEVGAKVSASGGVRRRRSVRRAPPRSQCHTWQLSIMPLPASAAAAAKHATRGVIHPHQRCLILSPPARVAAAAARTRASISIRKGHSAPAGAALTREGGKRKRRVQLSISRQTAS